MRLSSCLFASVSLALACVPEPPTPCTACDGACVDLQRDARHCGACGTSCAAGERCEAGACTATCGAGTTACAGACVDLQSSPSHCGACTNACPTGSACVAGACAAFCASPRQQCGADCADLQSDPAHCGACTTSCAAGSACVAGRCVAICPLPRQLCGPDCVDLMSDPVHCGACPTACPMGQVCSAGTCKGTCDMPLRQCGSACIDTQSDRQHCGGCTTACSVDEVCINGTCTLNCPAPLFICPVGSAGRCVDRRSDPAHCGDCATACDGGYCHQGACQPTCGPGLTECNAACVVTSTDPANCGACGRACPTALCAQGRCLDGPQQDLRLVTRTVDGGLIPVSAGTDVIGVSGTGDRVLFTTTAASLVAGVTTPTPSSRLYLRDTVTQAVEVPTRLDGGLDVVFTGADVAANGRELSFMSNQPDIAAGDTNGGFDAFVVNLDTGRREILTRTSAGAQVANSEGFPVWLFGDGRYALFFSRSNYDVAGGEFRPYRRDRVTQTTVELSREGAAWTDGCYAGFSGTNSTSYDLSPSGNVAVWDTAANYPGLDENNCNDVQARNVLTGARAVVSSRADGGVIAPTPGGLSALGVFLSDTRVLFRSNQPLVTPDTNGGDDLFVKDLPTGAVTRLDLALDGGQPNGPITYSAHALSEDRRYFVFESTATNLVPFDTNARRDCFEYDFALGALRRISLQSDGGQSTQDCNSVRISANGRFAVFVTGAALLPDDTNVAADVYLQRLR